VLLVEDMEVNRLVAVGMLGKLDVQADVAEDGETALEMIAGNDYAMVFMDVNLPDMDGNAVTGRMRERERERGLPRVPIVALTANAMRGDRQACLAAGMDDYLSKPILLDDLRTIVNRWLDEACRGPGEAGRDGAAVGDGASHPSPEISHGPGLDPASLDALRESFASSPDGIGEIIGSYLESVDRLCAQIAQAIAEDDGAAMARAGHSLKSNSATVGALELAGVAAEIEKIGRAGGTVGAAPLHGRLQAAFRSVRPELMALTESRK